jgi:hypothetical protein
VLTATVYVVGKERKELPHVWKIAEHAVDVSAGVSDRHVSLQTAQKPIALVLQLLWQSNTQTNLDLQNTTLGYGFHFQHTDSRRIPIEGLAHDSGRTLVCVEYGYPKGSPNTDC